MKKDKGIDASSFQAETSSTVSRRNSIIKAVWKVAGSIVGILVIIIYECFVRLGLSMDYSSEMLLFAPICVLLLQKSLSLTEHKIFVAFFNMAVCFLMSANIILEYAILDAPSHLYTNGVSFVLIGALTFGFTILEIYAIKPKCEAILSKTPSESMTKKYLAISGMVIFLLHGIALVLPYVNNYVEKTFPQLLLSVLSCVTVSSLYIAFDWMIRYAPKRKSTWFTVIGANLPYTVFLISLGALVPYGLTLLVTEIYITLVLSCRAVFGVAFKSGSLENSEKQRNT